MHKKQQQNIYFYKYISKNAVLQPFQRENIAIQETLTPPLPSSDYSNASKTTPISNLDTNSPQSYWFMQAWLMRHSALEFLREVYTIP